MMVYLILLIGIPSMYHCLVIILNFSFCVFSGGGGDVGGHIFVCCGDVYFVVHYTRVWIHMYIHLLTSVLYILICGLFCVYILTPMNFHIINYLCISVDTT